MGRGSLSFGQGFRSLILGAGLLAIASSISALAQSDLSVVSPRRGTVSVVRLQVPEKARTQFKEGVVAVAKGKLTDARKRIDAALAIAPNFPDALTTRAYLEVEANQFEAALADVEHAHTADPGFAMAYLVQASALNHLGHFDKALEVLGRYAEFEPNSWQCAFEMAKSWMGKQDYERALQQINRADALGGPIKIAADLHFLRGYALAGLRRYEQASSEFEAYLAGNPNGPFAGAARETLAQLRTAAALR